MVLVYGSCSIENSFIELMSWYSCVGPLNFFCLKFQGLGIIDLAEVSHRNTDLRIFVMHVLVSNCVWLQLAILSFFTYPSLYFPFSDTFQEYPISSLFHFQCAILYSASPHCRATLGLPPKSFT